MISPDVNLLIYACNPTAPEHKLSRVWLEDLLSGEEPVGFPDLCVYALMRFVTNPKLVPKPISFQQSVELIDSWLSLPHVSLLHPGERHWSLLSSISQGSRLRGAELTDAVIAAIAIEYGAIFHTNDRDFARFPSLRSHNPLLDA
jgi:toxin-antitoxin system PIN domain toxin